MKMKDMDVLFELSKIVKINSGIYFSLKKMNLFQLKTNNFICKENLNSISILYTRIKRMNDRKLLNRYINNFTVNTTSFFRDSSQFDFFYRDLLYKNRLEEKIKIWCGACSNGMEPYSIAMFLKDNNINNFEILATDLDSDILKIALKGRYTKEECEFVSKRQLETYFTYIKHLHVYEIKPSIKNKIIYRNFNLTNTFSFKIAFDYVFLRNVFIYFNDNTKKEILNKLTKVISKNGILFIGLAESIYGFSNDYELVFESGYRLRR